jgi:hypothetical protein
VSAGNRLKRFPLLYRPEDHRDEGAALIEEKAASNMNTSTFTAQMQNTMPRGLCFIPFVKSFAPRLGQR